MFEIVDIQLCVAYQSYLHAMERTREHRPDENESVAAIVSNFLIISIIIIAILFKYFE